MRIDNIRLNESILNFNNCTIKRNEVAEYYFKHGIRETMEHFRLTKQGVYCDVRAYKKFMCAYNLISNVRCARDFLDLRAKDIVPLFNNSKVGRFFDRNCRIEDIDFSDDREVVKVIKGAKSLQQYKKFVESYADFIIEGGKYE